MESKIYAPLFAIAYPKIQQVTFYCKFHADEKWRWLELEQRAFPSGSATTANKTEGAIFLHTDEYEEYAATIEVVNI
jgi:hypothetical protein